MEKRCHRTVHISELATSLIRLPFPGWRRNWRVGREVKVKPQTCLFFPPLLSLTYEESIQK